jgi:hypothetical protein
MQKWKKYILASDIISLYLALVLAIIVRGFVHVLDTTGRVDKFKKRAAAAKQA